jgi:hypothetical protein
MTYYIFFFFKITDYPGINATSEQMWADVQASIPRNITDLHDFAKDVRILGNFFDKKNTILSINVIYVDFGMS